MGEVLRSPHKLSTKKKVSSIIKKFRKASTSNDKTKDVLPNDVQGAENAASHVFAGETPVSPAKSSKALGKILETAKDAPNRSETINEPKTANSAGKNGSGKFKSAGKMVVKTAMKSATGSDDAGDLICDALDNVADGGIDPDSVKAPSKKQVKKQAVAAASIAGKIAIKSAKVALDMDDPNASSGKSDETADKVANIIGTVVGKSAKAGLGPMLVPVAAAVEVGSSVASASKASA